MQFFFAVKTDETEAHVKRYATTNYACTACGDENTVESVNLVPSGTHFTVICSRGHETNGMPPARFRNDGASILLARDAARKAACKAARRTPRV